MPFLKTEAPSLERVEDWINTDSIRLGDKETYLLYFWDYSCSCCREWLNLFQKLHEEYPNLNVIGVHSPDFDFEHDVNNLERTVKSVGLEHPIAQNSQKTVFEAFDLASHNQVVVVNEGSIAYKAYRRDIRDVEKEILDLFGSKREGVVLQNEKLPESDKFSQKYLGYAKTRGLNQEGNYPGKKEYHLPRRRKKENVYLKGVWKQTENYIEAKSGSELRFKTRSSKIDLSMSPRNGLRDVNVFINGENISDKDKGNDLRVEDSQSYLRVARPGLYNLINSDRKNIELTIVPEEKTRLYALNYR